MKTPYSQWKAKDILSRKSELQEEETKLRNELDILKSETDLSIEALAPRKLSLEKRIHEVRVSLSRLPGVEEIIPSFETEFSLERGDYQEFSEIIKSGNTQFVGKVESSQILDLFFVNEKIFKQIEANVHTGESINEVTEALESGVWCDKILGTTDSEFVFIAGVPDIYHLVFDSPILKKNETNIVRLSYSCFKISMTPQSNLSWEPSFDVSKVNESQTSVVIHKEVVNRVIVKIPCRYCGQLNEQTLSKCASCGASLRI